MMEATTGLRVFNPNTNQMATLVTDAAGTRLMFLNIDGGLAHQIGIDAQGNFIQSSAEISKADTDSPIPVLPLEPEQTTE